MSEAEEITQLLCRIEVLKQENAKLTNANTPPRFKLYYWPGFPGRGEFMRLVFAESNTPYEDVYRDLTFEAASQHCYASAGADNKKQFFAVPAIEDQDNEDVGVISQTCVIMRYLAVQCGLYPENPNKGFQAEVIMQDAGDLLAEGCKAWHAIDYNQGYDEQKEATRPFIDRYVDHNA
jgi:glutathione S-transferase